MDPVDTFQVILGAKCMDHKILMNPLGSAEST